MERELDRKLSVRELVDSEAMSRYEKLSQEYDDLISQEGVAEAMNERKQNALYSTLGRFAQVLLGIGLFGAGIFLRYKREI